ncbi:MAG: SemiSWEET family transporter [Candidatus Paceibacterota bacterium]
MTKGLEPFPSKNAWKRYLDYIMYGVGLFAPVVLIPQILQIYTTQDASGISLTTWALFVVVNILWAFYGAVHKDKHIFFANILMMVANLIVVIGILLY